MVQTSQRLAGINGGGSDGWDIFYRARRLKDAGDPIVELTVGEHDVRTHPVILAAMDQSARDGHTGYAMVPGVDGLRDKVAERVAARTGVVTTRDNVLITPGGQAALFSAHMGAVEPGGVGLYCDPYYATYPGTIRGAGAMARAVPCSPQAAFQPRRADLETAADGAQSLLINTPNNPTGVIYGRETLDAIAGFVKDHDLWLISDEVYETQVWDGTHLSPRALPGMAPRTLVIGSMSKSHAMTGSRCGWIVGPEDAIARLIDLATHTTYGVPGFVQDAALFALNEGPWLEDAVGAPFARRRDIALRKIAAQQVVRAVPPQGAMYLMLDVQHTGLSGEAFANGLLDQHQIAVMPGESFGQSAAGHVRVAMTVEDDAFEAALDLLLDYAARQAA